MTCIPIIAFLAMLLTGFTAKSDTPAGAMPFILDSHVYIQGKLMDSIPVSIIYDTGADRLYLDKDYMELSGIDKSKLRISNARMGGAGNSAHQTVPIIIDKLPLLIGDKTHIENITPIINLREILGRYVDGMIGNNALWDKPLIINYTDGYLLPVDKLTPEMTAGYTRLPAVFTDNRIDIVCELAVDSSQTIKGPFRLDLGCGSTVVLTNSTLEELDLNGKKRADCYFSAFGVGGDGTITDFRADSFSLLDNLTNVVISGSYNTEGALSERPYKGIIGNEILSHYDLIIDAPGKAVYARRNSSNDDSYQHSSTLQMGYVDRTDICDGWIVCSLYDKGIAHRAGIGIGDMIVAINGRPVKNISWEEQRKGLGLKGETEFSVVKADSTKKTYILNIGDEII